MKYVVGFLACALIILFAGKKLSYYGDLIGEKFRLGKAWVGLILMASVTSLPELMTGIGSSAIVQSADLAVGDILGSCAFNLGILAMMDVFVPRHQPLFSVASQSHVLSASLGIILITLAGLGLFLPKDIVITSWIGFTSILFVVIYFGSIRLIYTFDHNSNRVDTPIGGDDDKHSQISKARVIRNYVVFASIIVLAALALPYFAEHISEESGLSRSFVGTLLLAASTSLPEIAVSIAAVRMGSIDMAVGGLLGSNIFNIFILALDDLFYTRGHILKDASDINIISVFGTIIMSAIVIIGLTYRSKKKKYFLAWDAALIFVIYIINILLLYHLSV
jgi:cation:H+ antiporter